MSIAFQSYALGMESRSWDEWMDGWMDRLFFFSHFVLTFTVTDSIYGHGGRNSWNISFPTSLEPA